MNDAKSILKTLGRELDLRFIDRVAIDEAHAASVAGTDSSHAIRDDGALEAAIARQVQYAAYAEDPRAPDVAAVLAAAIMNHHPYVDGNKRTALQSMLVSLERNGCTLTADDAAIVEAFQGVAAGELDDTDFVHWARRHTQRNADPEPGPVGAPDPDH